MPTGKIMLTNLFTSLPPPPASPGRLEHVEVLSMVEVTAMRVPLLFTIAPGAVPIRSGRDVHITNRHRWALARR